ncbi:MAG: hypothetical protein ACTTG8_09950 [Catonella sp.]|uniref:hypothetical protein n=1 Tax=Catonella sp. TaxID=2382125 RepID=UPI003F9FFEA1
MKFPIKQNFNTDKVIENIRKCVTFVLKYLSVLLVGDTKIVTDINGDMKKIQ